SNKLPMDKSRWIGAALALGYFCICVALTQHVPRSWNDISRVEAIESLVERGTWAIDDSPWRDRTADKILLDGKFYSDKMPLLSWVTAGAYFILKRAKHASLAPACAV